jgi:hypothetical protein
MGLFLRVPVAAFLGVAFFTGAIPESTPAVLAAATPVCLCIPSTAALDAGFQLAGVGRLGPEYPLLPRIGVDSAIVPPSLLKAVAWVESNWRQFDDANVPLLSPDFGYGLMQITSGMAGAFGNPRGTLPLSKQARIGGDYLYNLAFGARMLALDFKAMPAVNNRDPTAIEDWYYALWAYNGWGWVNNPNNPQFTRQGTPAADAAAFPYQERVLYWVAHPPLDASGRPLWTPMRVTLPSSASIESNPGPIRTSSVHHQVPHVYGAAYDIPSGLTAIRAGATTQVHVTVYNASGVAWSAGQRLSYGLMYHWVRAGHRGQENYDPNLHGVDVADGGPVPLRTTVPVGGSVRIAVKLTAPARPGKYQLEWDMWGRGPGWFSYSSVPPGEQTVRVVPAGEPVPSYIDPPPPVGFRGNHAWLVTSTSGPVPSVLTPGAQYAETDLVFNPGGLAWGRGYHLRLVGTARTEGLPLKYVARCRTVPLTIQGTAPVVAGSYQYVWRLQAAGGRLFGPLFRIAFTVEK